MLVSVVMLGGVTVGVVAVTVTGMTEETRIALRNYDWMVRNRHEIELAWDSDTLVDASGGYDINVLCDEGFTPATSGDWRSRAD